MIAVLVGFEDDNRIGWFAEHALDGEFAAGNLVPDAAPRQAEAGRRRQPQEQGRNHGAGPALSRRPAFLLPRAVFLETPPFPLFPAARVASALPWTAARASPVQASGRATVRRSA